jgi:cob(I)alamin adenosyltransferase
LVFTGAIKPKQVINEINMRYFTGKGDQGDSNLYDGRRFSKGDLVFDLIGTLDEANAYLGMAVSYCNPQKLKSDLCLTQNQLSILMGIIAGVKKDDPEKNSILVEATDWLEKMIAKYGKSINDPQGFVNAGETTLGAAIDITRTVIRRAERIAVKYFGVDGDGKKYILAYLNRLSSFLYILRLFADQSGIRG